MTGCTYTNTGFDGASYKRLWPDGNTKLHPTSFQFTSPVTGPDYNIQYSSTSASRPTCRRPNRPAIRPPARAARSFRKPTRAPAEFYPFYTTTKVGGHCYWQFGNDIPGEISNFGQNAQYGTLLQQNYTNVGGGSSPSYEDFRNIISNPCPQNY